MTHLVVLIIASQIRQNAGTTGDNVNVVGPKQLDQHSQKTLSTKIKSVIHLDG